ncbi:hypothetical protein FisN_6Lh338 [Fistulifera solaris]|uniref:Methyltransferase domain-containing protein n=1 Tax=Fistulifera solaris TaxID=1519565 RepID=A0A1Z5JKL6_FISSO|nr:hypothetical protein FisN_6Lh338 [Fistulifera solaris]|eukprot:GAX14560.1 hypothetical protein FisN_6Lh338 [Fistulifera solaris]
MKAQLALSLLASTDSLSTIPITSCRTFLTNKYCPDRRGFLGWTASLIPTCANALTPEEASRQYDTYAPSYDDLDGGKVSVALGIEDARRKLISKAKGDVLEIGVGTGLNLDKYLDSQLTSLTLVDISEGMLKEALSRLESLPNLKKVPVKWVQADATSQLVDFFGKKSFDTVIDSFSLCVMGNTGAVRSLQQMADVSRNEVLLLENSRSSNAFLGWYQDITADAAAMAGGKGCVYNQDVAAMIQSTTNLQILEETSYAAGLYRSFVCKVMN